MAAIHGSFRSQGHRRFSFNRSDSRSYLIQPEMSPSPTQFSMSPVYSYAGNVSPGHYVLVDKSLQNCSDLSLSSLPLLCDDPSGSTTDTIRSNCTYGVGDLEQIQGESAPGRQSIKVYDYADCGHQYEELPGGRKDIEKCPTDSGIDSRSEHYQSSGGTTDIMSESGDTAVIANTSEKRKRVNPLYDVMTQSVPSIYNKSSREESLQRQIRCLRTALIIFMLLSCVAMAVSVYAVAAYTSTQDESDPRLTPQVQRLTEDFTKLEDILAALQGNNNTMDILADLIHQVSALERNTTAQVGLLHQQIANTEKNVSRNTLDIGLVHAEISTTIAVMNSTVHQQLDSISKMEGPQGPQGVANFSQCEYKNSSSNMPASVLNPSYSPWVPEITQLEESLAIFASCSVTFGKNVMLHTNIISTTAVQYQCECSGVVEGMPRRFCYVHMLVCPRNS